MQASQQASLLRCLHSDGKLWRKRNAKQLFNDLIMIFMTLSIISSTFGSQDQPERVNPKSPEHNGLASPVSGKFLRQWGEEQHNKKFQYFARGFIYLILSVGMRLERCYKRERKKCTFVPFELSMFL